MVKPRRIVLVAVVGAGMLSMLATAVFMQQNTSEAARVYTPKQTSLPIYYDVPDFSFTGIDAEPFTQEDLLGQVVIVDFIFTACPGLCPMMTKEMKEIHDEFANESSLKFVSITVDPETDTPEVLAAFSERYEADPERWKFLTGDLDEIMDLSTAGFKLGSAESPQDHSSKFVLVDRKGRIRGYYDSLMAEEVEELRQHIHRLL